MTAGGGPETENARPEPVSVWVVGPPGLLRDVLVYVLTRRGVPTCNDPEGPEAESVVAVLIEPTAADWQAAHDQGMPIVVVVERPLDDQQTVAMVMQGAEAIVATDDVGSTIRGVLEVVAGGGTQLTPCQSRALAGLARKTGADEVVSLTPRERQIIDSIAGGASVKQTALELGISAKTVENLQSRLFRKLGVRNRAQAVATAHAMGLFSPAG